MEEENNDVEALYAQLDKELADKDSGEEETPGAGDQEPTDKVIKSESQIDDENAEMTEEELSKESPRAQKRIKDLLEKNKALTDSKKREEETPIIPTEEKPDPAKPVFKTVQDYLDAVEDEDTRNLLEGLSQVMMKELSSTVEPLQAQKNTIEFEKQFKEFEGLEDIVDFKDDLMMTYQRDPSKSVKALVGETLVDLQTKKVATSVDTPSQPDHSGEINTDGMELEDLYSTLDTLKQ